MKAILELPEMPHECRMCELCMPVSFSIGERHICAGIFGELKQCPKVGKRTDCPLEPKGLPTPPPKPKPERPKPRRVTEGKDPRKSCEGR